MTCETTQSYSWRLSSSFSIKWNVLFWVLSLDVTPHKDLIHNNHEVTKEVIFKQHLTQTNHRNNLMSRISDGYYGYFWEGKILLMYIYIIFIEQEI